MGWKCPQVAKMPENSVTDVIINLGPSGAKIHSFKIATSDGTKVDTVSFAKSKKWRFSTVFWCQNHQFDSIRPDINQKCMGGPNNYIERGRELFGDVVGHGRYVHHDILKPPKCLTGLKVSQCTKKIYFLYTPEKITIAWVEFNSKSGFRFIHFGWENFSGSGDIKL